MTRRSPARAQILSGLVLHAECNRVDSLSISRALRNKASLPPESSFYETTEKNLVASLERAIQREKDAELKLFIWFDVRLATSIFDPNGGSYEPRVENLPTAHIHEDVLSGKVHFNVNHRFFPEMKEISDAEVYLNLDSTGRPVNKEY